MPRCSNNPTFTHPALILLLDCPNANPKIPNPTLFTIHQIHAHLITTGLAHHSVPLSRLLRLSLPFSYALSILLSAPRPTTFLFNTLISSLASRRLTPQALFLYSHLLHPLSPSPNAHTFPSLLSACTSHPHFHPHARSLHTHLIKFLNEEEIDQFIHAALLSFYSRLSDLPLCRRLFDRIPNPDLPIWNSILSAYATSTCLETLFLFQNLQVSLTLPNEITLVAVINACGALGALGQGAWAHAYITRKGLAMNRFVGTALVDMYAKCGRLDLAHQVFDVFPKRDTLCYNTMIRGFAVHGHGWGAIGLFQRMVSEGVGVDDVTMVVVMSACAHAGLVDEGRRWFNSMQGEFGMEPKVEHYGCLVDLLGRAGRLEEAEGVIQSMPMEPNAVMYRALLGACRTHGDLEMGERIIARLMELEPEHGGHYILMSNMYASIDQWDGVRRVRRVMKEKGINKSPGSSLVEMDGAIHEFITGDKAHPYSKEIYALLDVIDRSLYECLLS